MLPRNAVVHEQRASERLDSARERRGEGKRREEKRRGEALREVGHPVQKISAGV